MKYKEINQKNINEFVVLFYTNIIKDEKVGPFFIEILGEDINNTKWQTHIELLTDFWASMLLNDDNYSGSPFAPHVSMKALKRETFQRWIEILDETLNTLYEEETSKTFKQIGQIMSRNFMRNLGL